MSDFVAQIVLSFNQYILIFLKSFDHLRVADKIPHEKCILLESSSFGSERDNDWKQFNHDDINSKINDCLRTADEISYKKFVLLFWHWIRLWFKTIYRWWLKY